MGISLLCFPHKNIYHFNFVILIWTISPDKYLCSPIRHLAVFISDYGKSMLLVKATPEQRLYFLSNTYELSAMMSQMTFLPSILSISEMHLFGQIIRI